MAARFDLMRMPDLQKEKVIKLMTCPEVITFSRCSAKTYELAQRHSHRPTLIAAKFRENGFYTEFSFMEEDPDTFGFRFMARPLNQHLALYTIAIQAFAGGAPRPVENRTGQYSFDAMLSVMIELTDSACQLFDERGASEKSMFLKLAHQIRLNELSAVLKWTPFQTLTRLSILGNAEVPMSHEQLDYVMDNFEISDELLLLVSIVNNRPYSLRKVSATTIVLQCTPPWLISDEFLDNLIEKAENAYISHVTISGELINRIIKQWLQRPEAPPLKFLQFERLAGSEFDRMAVERELDVKPWDPTKRAGIYIPKNRHRAPISCELFNDVYRADGLIASLLIEPKSFQMIVWRPPQRDSDS